VAEAQLAAVSRVTSMGRSTHAEVLASILDDCWEPRSAVDELRRQASGPHPHLVLARVICLLVPDGDVDRARVVTESEEIDDTLPPRRTRDLWVLCYVGTHSRGPAAPLRGARCSTRRLGGVTRRSDGLLRRCYTRHVLLWTPRRDRSVAASVCVVGLRMSVVGGLAAISLGVVLPRGSRWVPFLALALTTCLLGAIVLGIGIGVRRAR